MQVKPSDKTYYMDGYLLSNLDMAKKVIQKDWDFVFLIDGSEGGGKSVMAQQCATYCDTTFNVERITFTPKEFEECIKKADKYQAVVYDEAYTGLSSRGTMTDINKVLVSMLAEIRQKNLFVFIVMPTFFDLDKYVALWRSRALIHVYTAEGFERGYFGFYNVDLKKELYVNGKKYYSYRTPRPNFTGRFTNVYTVDETEYRKRKLKALTDGSEGRKSKEQQVLPYILSILCEHLSQRQIEQKLKERGFVMSDSTIHKIISKIPKESAIDY